VKTYLATRNAGKLRELKAIFAGSELAPSSYRKYSAVAENEDSYAGNALTKARALAAALQQAGVCAWALADDSGLEVDALGGRPGVHSARYGGAQITWPQRRAALLAELRGVPPFRRTARFLCALALVRPDREPLVVTGHVGGLFLESESGSGGFGYDALFFHLPSGRSFAALSQKEKNAVSHRRRAADALVAALHRGE
jgi:XTP/dITP diphosphohydrolase